MLEIDYWNDPAEEANTVTVGLGQYSEMLRMKAQVDTLCELAKDDVVLRPETILKTFGRYEDASTLAKKRAQDRENFLAWIKEDIAMGGGTDDPDK